MVNKIPNILNYLAHFMSRVLLFKYRQELHPYARERIPLHLPHWQTADTFLLFHSLMFLLGKPGEDDDLSNLTPKQRRRAQVRKAQM